MSLAEVWRARAARRLEGYREARRAARGEICLPEEPRPQNEPPMVHFAGATQDGEDHPAMRFRRR